MNFIESANVIDVLAFDNVLVQGVTIPEPSMIAWAGAIALLGGTAMWLHRRTDKSRNTQSKK